MLSINRISIKNFRQYQDVNLNFDSSSGIFLFIGKNGIGKSNFLNAICWCLYGTQPFKFHDKEKKLLNEEIGKQNEFDEVKVSIEVNMDEKLFLFQRIYRDTWDEPQFIVMSKQGENWVPFSNKTVNPTVIVNNFLPESVSKFFLFDGEAVQNLYRGAYSENLKEGVWKVSDVALLDRASKDISGTMSQIHQLVSKDEPDTEQLEADKSKLEKEVEEMKSSLSAKQLEFEESKSEREKLSEEMKRYSAHKNLQDKRDILKRELEEARGRSDIYQQQINDSIIKLGPFWYIRHLLSQLAQEINKVSESGQLPPKIKGTFIKELIEKQSCICGTPILSGSKELQTLNRLLENVEPLDSRSYLIEDKIEISNTIKDLQNTFPVEFKTIRERLAVERKKIDEIELELKEISEKLVKVPGQVGSIESTIRRLNEQIDLTSQEIGQIGILIKQKVEQITEYKNKLDKLIGERGRRKTEQRRMEFLEEAKDKIDYIRERLIVQVGKSVSNYTNQYFKELMWKKDEFQKVNFTDDFKVEVYKNGESSNDLEILSTGEMKVLSFATIKALAKLSGFNNVPVFIDGPLENLDKEVRNNFLEQLPDFFKDKQVFIFSLDSDLIEEFGRKVVRPENFFRLTRKGDSFSTIVEQYNKNE